MTPAKVIPFPVPAEAQAQQPAKASFTRLDNATDMAALYSLPNALLKPALCLLEHRHMRPLHWGEVASTIGRGATQTREALSRLAELGYAVSEGDTWAWAGSTAARKSVRKPVRKSVRKPEFSPLKKSVWVGVSFALKEVKKEKKENNNTEHLWKGIPPQAPVVVGAALALEKETPQTPVQEKTDHHEEVTINVTDTQKVAPAAETEGSNPVAAAHAALEAAGLGDVWADWFASTPALSRNRVALQAQICQFAAWVDEDLGDKLSENVLDIVSAGTYAHPFNALKARMEKAKAVQHAEKRSVVEMGRTFGEAQCQPGERRRAPDGRVWTVAYVEYGMVFFEESASPNDVPDRVAATWAVDA